MSAGRFSVRPLAIDLFAGLGGWADGCLAEGFDVVGFDIERHVYGEHQYPAQLVIQDVLTIHGSQFRDAALIVCSPPCQFFSYTAMPWSIAKERAERTRADPELLTSELALFNACFRIQREACEAAGRHVPMVVENVRGAIPWVGRSRWNFGSYHLWGDVPALMPITLGRSVMKNGVAHRANGETNFHGHKVTGLRQISSGADHTRHLTNQAEHLKNTGGSWFNIGGPGQKVTNQNPVHDGIKMGGTWRHDTTNNIVRHCGSKSSARKAASAMIARIPLPLARHIGATYYPREERN